MFNKINLNNIIMGIIPASYFLWTDQFTGACVILFLLIVLDTMLGQKLPKRIVKEWNNNIK